MKKALLPALIAGIFTMNGAIAADRELLFGPAELASTAPTQKVIKRANVAAAAAPKVPAAAAPVVAKAEPKIVAKPVTAAAPVVAKAEPKIVAEPVAAAAPVVAKAEPKIVAKPVAAAAPVVAKAEPVAVVAPVVAKVENFAPSALASSMPPMAKSEGSSVSVGAGSNALSVREQLGQKIKQEVTIGFFPSATTEAGAYNFLRSFMPLSNHLSQGSGVLTSLIPERDVKVYASRIMEQRYPVIFVNAALADTALDAGYAPLVVGEEILTPGFLVQESSKYKKIEDIKGAKIAYTRNAQTSFLAFADLAQQGIAQSANQSTDVGAAGRKGALDLLNSGAADVAILRSAEAQKIAQESNGKLRFIGSSVSAPSTGVWVRKDVVGTGLASALQASLLTVSPDATGSAKLASDGFSAGFGVRGKFVAADDETKAMFASLFGKAKTSYPDLFAKPEFDAKKASENLNRVAIQPLGNTK